MSARDQPRDPPASSFAPLEQAYRPRPLTDLPKTARNQTVLEPVPVK